MKKTPKDFAASHALVALRALVAVSAASAVVNSLVAKASAKASDDAAYNPAEQKSVGPAGEPLNSYTSVSTGSIAGYTEDNKFTSDQY